MIPSITIVGNLAADPELRYTQQGVAVATFTVMTSKRTKQGDEWVDEKTTPWKVTVWDNLAENVVSSLAKGHPVIVSGQAYENSWEKDGQTYRRIEVTAYNVGVDLARRSVTVGDKPAAALTAARKPAPLPPTDVPF